MVRAAGELCKAFPKQTEVTNCMEQVEVHLNPSLEGERLDVQRDTGTIQSLRKGWKHQKKEVNVIKYTENDQLGAGHRGIPEAMRGELLSDCSVGGRV